MLAAEPCPEEQIGLGGREATAELDRLVDRLSARLGRRRVTRLVAHDSHIPELAASAAPAQATARVEPGWDGFRRFRADADLARGRCGCSPGPSRSRTSPLVPDGPPVRFRWRRALHEVVAAEGPERIEGAWWSEDGGPRRATISASRIKAGLRFWLFRAGLYRDLAARSPPRWFLHGMYA